MCYTIGPFWLSILYIAVCTCQWQTPDLKDHIKALSRKGNSILVLRKGEPKLTQKSETFQIARDYENL